MAVEQYLNVPESLVALDPSSTPWTTLNGAILAGAATLTVTDPSAFPTVAPFSIRVGVRDVTTLLVTNSQELRVLAVAGSVFTITAETGGSVLAHANGESIWYNISVLSAKNNPLALTASGDIPYLNSSLAQARLAAPSNGDYVIRWTSGVPTWVAAGSGSVTGTGVANQLAYWSGASALAGDANLTWDGTSLTVAGATYMGNKPDSFGSPNFGTWQVGQEFIGPFAGSFLEGASITQHFIWGVGDTDSEVDAFQWYQIFDVAVDASNSIQLANLFTQTTTLANSVTLGTSETIRLSADYQGDGTIEEISQIDQFISVQSGLTIEEGTYWRLRPPTVNGAILIWNGMYIEDQTVSGATENFSLNVNDNLLVASNGAAIRLLGPMTATDFIVSGSAFKTDTVDGHQAFFQAYDVNNTIYRTFFTLTNGNTPTGNISAPSGGTLAGDFTTLAIGGAAVATQTYVGAQGFVTASSVTAFTNKTGNITQWTNDASYTTLAAVAGVGYATLVGAESLTNKKLGSLTSNGFVKTSGGDGTLSVDTATYLTSVTAHNLLSATHGDTTAGSVARGDLITGQGASPKWVRLAKGTANQVLAMDGTATDILWVTPSSGGVTSIATTSPISGGTITTTGTISLLVNVDHAFTAGQSITAPAGASALTLTGGTQTSNFPALTATQTWNASGTTFTGWKLNITDTASAAGSLLIDVQSGGSSRFAVTKFVNASTDEYTVQVRSLNKFMGLVLDSTFAGGVGQPNLYFAKNGVNKFQFGLDYNANGTADFFIYSLAASKARLYLGSAGAFGFGGAIDAVSGGALNWGIDATNTLTLRNSTNAQTVLVYAGWTSATNYSTRLALAPTAGSIAFNAESAGATASADINLVLTPKGAGVINLNGPISAAGTAGVTTFGPAAVASITVKNGLVVAIS